MTPVQILFIIVATVTLGAALMVVSSRNLVHSAFWLIAALFGVAVVFALLQAGFLAVVQVVVYIGAIAILIIFALMLTRRINQPDAPRFNESPGLSAVIAAAIFVILGWILTRWSGISALPPNLSPRTDTLQQLGVALVSVDGYLLPFEVASILLLAALVGAIFIAWEKK